MITEILARTATRLAVLVLSKDSSAAHQCFRVKNLHADEVLQFVNCWPELALAKGLNKVRLVVADSLNGAIPADYVAEQGCSITHYRNNNPDGLVYIETSVQSDEQGLQNMFSLRDSNFLDGSFDEYAKPRSGVPELLIDEAWRAAGGDGSTPALLRDHLLHIVRLVHPAIEPVPVRRFIGFIEEASRKWVSYAGIIDPAEAGRIVGDALWAMDMFPDPLWNHGAESRWRRRLELNSRHADLVDGSIELDAEAIENRALTTKFVGRDGEPMQTSDALKWRDLCISYGANPSTVLRQQIPYEIFSQLFSKDLAGLRLGDRVRAEIVNSAPARLDEFDALDVTAGLNTKSSHDANRLLEAIPPVGLKPLPDLLSSTTRKSLERHAAPPRKRFFNPIIEIVRQAQRVTSDSPNRQIGVVELHLQNDQAVAVHMQGLFAFLFGATLRSVSATVEGVPGSCQLVLHEALVSQVPPPELVDEEEYDEDREPLLWEPLQLRFTFKDMEGRVLEVMEQMEWIPPDVQYFAFMWLLATAHDSPALDHIGTLRLAATEEGTDWLTSIVRRETSMDALILDPEQTIESPDAHFQELLGLRRQLRSNLSSEGLELAVLQAFLDRWQTLFMQVRASLVPEGVRSRELDALLGCDMLIVDDIDRRLMLALHPIRLRWVCRYLEQTMKLSVDFLSGEAAFSDGEGSLFLDWLERLTPREAPPIAAGSNGQLIYSRAEVGWCEEFSPLDPEAGDVTFDSGSLASIAHRVASYLETHPYKRDGLSILVVMPTSDGMAGELLKRIIAKAGGSVRIFLYVAAPKSRWEAIARAVESLSEGVDSAPRSRLFPDRDLAFMDYRAGQSMSELLVDHQIDIAVVTHVLQEQIVSQQNTEAPVERPGVHDPLLHRPIRLEVGGRGSAISLVMLPKYPDLILESWSTLVVRANRSRPVAPGQPENTDFVELRVNFQDSARLFRDLHDHCHWVITLERHISREQIESEEAGAPDVLSIEDGIGANRLNTLIVSSRSGRELIHSRLLRKLRRLVPVRRLEGQPSDLLSELASGIYESIRQIAPRLALQALGVARVTEEIVGLTVARNLAEALFPAQISNGLVAWISLDEHTEWFGGHAQIRADMCRLSFEQAIDGTLEVDVLVLEGKLRQLFDGHGVLQVKRTCEFFESIVGEPGGQQVRRIDHLMWCELFASAVERLAEEAVTIHSQEAADSPGSLEAVRELTISLLRSGALRLRSVLGVYSACLWDSEDENLVRSEENGVIVLKSTRSHLIDLVRLRERRDVLHYGSSVPTFEAEMFLRPEVSADVVNSVVIAEAVQTPERSNSIGGATSSASAQIITTPEAVPECVHPAQQSVQSECAPSSVAPIQSSRKGLDPNVLQRMYEDILGCFGQHGVSVFAASSDDSPFVEGPASVLFKVKPGSGIDPRKLSEKGAALKLVLELEQEQNVSFNIDRGFVTIDVPKRPEQRYFVDGAETWTKWHRPSNALAVPIGEDRFGSLVEFNFSSANSPHLLVAGTTGSGKSEALNTILFGLTRHYTVDELRLMLVDPKGTELAPFEGSPYLEGQIGWDDTDSLALLQRAVEEMQRRYVLFREASTRSLVEFNAGVSKEKRLPWWVIVLDEYADLTHDPQSKKDIEAELKRLAQKARAAGIHVIIATQKPSADVISTNLRSNLPAQLALRVKSAIESRVVIDEAGAENLNGKGDALLKADGKLLRVQCSRVDPSDWSDALSAASPRFQ